MYIAVMLPFFQSSGRLPSSSDLRSRMSSGGVSASAVSLNTRGCHPSGPGDLLGFIIHIWHWDVGNIINELIRG